MRTVVSAEEMRWCDETAIRSYRIPSLLLMENAGAGVTRLIASRFSPVNNKTVLVVCGKGNNAGDGFVIARHLSNQGAQVNVILLNAPAELKGDAKSNFEILSRIAKTSGGRISIEKYSPRFLKERIRCDVIVDAIFGTGFKGAVGKPQSGMIDWINAQQRPVVSVDVPSGIDGTTGLKSEVAVCATMTGTMGALKTGLLCNHGRDCAGEIEVVDIGIPNEVYDHRSLTTRLLEARDVALLLPKRASTVHKYSVGKVFILAGSRGLTGAATLAAQASLRAGAGAVMLGTPESVYPIIARKLSEVIVRPLPSTPTGSLSLEGAGDIRERISWADVVVVGPGLSQDEETQKLVKQLLTESRSRIVVDADGLNALSAFGPRLLKKLESKFILTPHTGEFSRLTGVSSNEVESDRVHHARNAASGLGVTLVLKGAPTATASPDGQVFLNPTGNPGMATVGSGDVLSGIIATLWAQGMEPPAAAFSGVYLHGLSGDLAKAHYGERSIVAQDLIDFLPPAFLTLQEKR